MLRKRDSVKQEKRGNQRQRRHLSSNGIPASNLGPTEQETDNAKRPKLKVLLREFALPVGRELSLQRKFNEYEKKSEPNDKPRTAPRRNRSAPSNIDCPILMNRLQSPVCKSDTVSSAHRESILIESGKPSPERIEHLQNVCAPEKDGLVKLPADAKIQKTATHSLVKDRSPRLNRVQRLSTRHEVTGLKSRPRIKTKPKQLYSTEEIPCSKRQRRFLDNESEDSIIGAFADVGVEEEENPYTTIISLKAELQYHLSTASSYKNANVEIKRECERAEASCAALALKLEEKERDLEKLVSENEKLKTLNEELNAKLLNSAEKEKITSKNTGKIWFEQFCNLILPKTKYNVSFRNKSGVNHAAVISLRTVKRKV